MLIFDAPRNDRFTVSLSIIHSLIPKIEATSIAGFQDLRGKNIVRELGDLAKKDGEGFYH